MHKLVPVLILILLLVGGLYVLNGYSLNVDFSSSEAKAPERDSFFRRTKPLTITTSSLPTATAGVQYSATVKATGGTPPYSWSDGSGDIVISYWRVDSSTSAKFYTPILSSSGRFKDTIIVKDSAGRTAEKTFTLEVIDRGGYDNPDYWNGGSGSGSEPLPR